jgi:hypothetical protein
MSFNKTITDEELDNMSRQELYDLNVISTKHLSKRELNEFNKKRMNSCSNFQEWEDRLGYPQCCVNEYTAHLISMRSNLPSNYDNKTYKRLEKKAGTDGTGFRPCLTHIKQLAKKEITIEELLKNRRCRYAFPEHGRKCNTDGWVEEGEDTTYYFNYPKYYIHSI